MVPNIARRHRPNRRGAMLILVLLMFIILIVTVVFSVDVASMQLARTQLRIATDAAARAAIEALSRTQSVTQAHDAAVVTAAKNDVFNAPLELAEDDIVFGRGTFAADGTVTFQADQTPTNGVRIRGRRTADSPSGPVSLFFGRVLSVGRFEPVQTATSINLDRDIVLVVDRSGSMKYSVQSDNLPAGKGTCDPPHATVSRWAALNTAVGSFITGLNETVQIEWLSLVSYAGTNTSCGMSFTQASVDAVMNAAYSDVTAKMAYFTSIPINGSTNIDAGLTAAINELTNPARTRPHASKTIVLLTDGVYNQGRDPRDVAEIAAASDITVHTITFSDYAERQAMEDVAEITGGYSYHAPDAATLNEIFREIALTLPVIMTE
jgi:Flp pilus assembly protein TadG